jgi:hypothetical protein
VTRFCSRDRQTSASSHATATLTTAIRANLPSLARDRHEQPRRWGRHLKVLQVRCSERICLISQYLSCFTWRTADQMSTRFQGIDGTNWTRLRTADSACAGESRSWNLELREDYATRGRQMPRVPPFLRFRRYVENEVAGFALILRGYVEIE